MNIIKKYSFLKELAEFLEKQEHVTDPEEKRKLLGTIESDLAEEKLMAPKDY